MSVMRVDDRSFEQEVLHSDLPVLVDFWAPWCGPCRAMSSVVDTLADELKGRVRVVKVNVDEAPETAMKFGIQSIPTFAVFDGGQVRSQTMGVVPKSMLAELVSPVLNG